MKYQETNNTEFVVKLYLLYYIKLWRRSYAVQYYDRQTETQESTQLRKCKQLKE